VAYYLVPDGDAGNDVYAVLREALAKTGKTALSCVVIAQRERTIALRPMGNGLAGGLEQTVATSNAVSLPDSLRTAPGRASSLRASSRLPSTKRRLVR
jgi:non-homologous end joining protein Ku